MAWSEICLFVVGISLLRAWNFPVSLCREFRLSLLNLHVDRTRGGRQKVQIRDNSLFISLLAGNLALETGWRLTASSASQSGLSNYLRMGAQNARGSAAFAGSCSVSAFRIRSRMGQSRRRSPEAIFGVSFLGTLSLNS